MCLEARTQGYDKILGITSAFRVLTVTSEKLESLLGFSILSRRPRSRITLIGSEIQTTKRNYYGAYGYTLPEE